MGRGLRCVVQFKCVVSVFVYVENNKLEMRQRRGEGGEEERAREGQYWGRDVNGALSRTLGKSGSTKAEGMWQLGKRDHVDGAFGGKSEQVAVSGRKWAILVQS